MKYKAGTKMPGISQLPTRCAILLLAAFLVQSVTCTESAKQTLTESASSNTESSFKSDYDSVLANKAQKSNSEDSAHATNIPDLSVSQLATEPSSILPSVSGDDEADRQIFNEDNIESDPIFESGLLDTPANYRPLAEYLYPNDLFYGQDVDESRKVLSNESPEYVIFNIPLDQESETPREDKRFMRGLNFKRDGHFMDTSEGVFSNKGQEDKRFMRGFSRYNKKDDKRFMRGLQGLNDGYTYGKRFIIGLNRLARPVEKRFMRGFGGYGKRFIHGLENYGKRFMRGLSKRDDAEALEYKKRFIVGLKGYGPQTHDHFVGVLPAGTDEINKRFMRGLHSYKSAIPGKRFMKGLTLYSKKYSPGEDVEYTEESGISSDKRFMRGLTKKHEGFESEIEDNGSGNENIDKRFIKGLVGRSGSLKNSDKRFMRGLHKKSDDLFDGTEKRFIKGLVRKSEEKRFMRGLNKKSDETEDKRFIKGLAKKEHDDDESLLSLDSHDNDGDENIDKKFMRGFGKKNTEEDELHTVADKRFMRGLYAKKNINDQTEESKRFMKGFQNLVKKDHELTDDELNNVDENRQSEEAKRFIKGLTKNDASENNKRFIKGLRKYVKKDETLKQEEGSGNSEEKRFMRGLAKKENEFSDGSNEKRFIRGLGKKSENSGVSEFIQGFERVTNTDSEPDKRFMRGLMKKEDISEIQSEDKRFMKGLVKIAKKDEGEDKRFMKGLVGREAGQSREKRETRFRDERYLNHLRNLAEERQADDDVEDDESFETDASGTWHDLPAYTQDLSLAKRFMRGLGQYAKREYPHQLTSNELDDIDDSDISKRFLRGFIKNYNGREFLPKRFQYPVTKSEDSGALPALGKRFIKGLGGYNRPVNGKRFSTGDLDEFRDPSSDYSLLQDKRFMRGLTPQVHASEKRFIRGFGKYSKRPIEGRQFDNPYLGATLHKRLITGNQQVVSDDQQTQQSPSYTQPQFMRSYYSDQYDPYQPNRETRVNDPYSTGASGIESRPFVAWRNGGYTQG